MTHTSTLSITDAQARAQKPTYSYRDSSIGMQDSLADAFVAFAVGVI